MHEGSDDDENRSSSHADTTTSEVSKGTSEEETSYDGSDGVCGVDSSNGVRVRVVEVGDPVFRSLDSVEDGGIVSVEHHARCCHE